MEIVICPKCHTRVAPCDDGKCPACRRQLRAVAPELIGDAPSVSDDSSGGPSAGSSGGRTSPASNETSDASQPIGNLFDLTERLLSMRPFAGKCCVCTATDRMVCDIQADHEEFSAVLPIHICHCCVRKPPFAPPRDTRSLIYCASLALMVAFLFAGQFIVALLCFGAGIIVSLLVPPPKPLTAKEQSKALRKLVWNDSAFRLLLEGYSDITFSLPETSSVAARKDETIAQRFTESVQMRSAFFYVTSHDELARSCLPSPIGQALAELIDRTVVTRLRDADGAQGLFVQASCAILPGGKNAFEVQGLPPDATADLLLDLSALPSWPVAYPVLLMVQRQLRGSQVVAQPDVDAPFATWHRRLAPNQEVSIVEIVLQFHDVDLPDEPVEIKSEYIEAFRSRLPDQIDLAVLHAEFLQATARYEESLAVCDTLIEQYPGHSELRRLRVSCLEGADQLERAAAECQAILVEFPNEAMTLGHLAHLQLRMSRPEDALTTTSEALAHESHSQLHLVQAQARVALGQFDLAITDLDRAVAQDANTAEAYLLRARLHLHRGEFDRALSDIDDYQRTADKSIESLYLQAVAFRGKGEIDAAIEVLDVTGNEAEEALMLRVHRADFLAEAGKLELALADCDLVIDRFPGFAPAYSTRAAVHLEGGRSEAAMEDAELAMELGLTTSRNFMIRGLAKAAAEDYEQADEDLSQAIDLDEENVLARYNRGRLRAARDDLSAAIEDFSAAIGHNPDWSDARVQRGFLQLAEEQPDAALADFEAAIQVSPTMAEAYRGRALVHQQQGRKPEALADLNKAVLLDPDNVACRMARTTLLLDESDTDAAKADLDAALQLAPDLIPALFQRGQLHLSLGEHEAARRDFDAVLEQDPDSAFAFIGRSVAREQAGDLEQSARDADEATQSDPLKAEELELARLLMNATAAHAKQQFDKAAAYATEAIELDPQREEAYRIRAAAHWCFEQFVEALEDYDCFLERVDDPDAGCYNGRGQVYAEMGEFELALGDLDRAVAMARDGGSTANLAYCLNGRGRALTGLERYDEAEQAFEESLRLRPDNAWLHYNRGLLYVARGEPAQAVACFELALHVSKPGLTPRKSARAKGFLEAYTAMENPG